MTDTVPHPARRPPVKARHRPDSQLPELADRGRLPHDPEQPRPRGGREPGRARRLRRHRQGGAQLGVLRRDPRALRELGEDETLLVQSGKPVGVFRTHADAPRVLIANSNLVPHWATWEHFHELDRKGLMMYGQMTAGSWIYIGSQGIVQGTYETFVEAGRQHYGGSLAGRWILTAGLGGMGGAQPLAATLAGALLADHRVPAAPHRHAPARRATSTSRRSDLDEALARIAALHGREARRCRSACSATPPRCCPSWCGAEAGGLRPDVVTDQTSAHDLVQRLPAGGLDASSAGAPRRPTRRSTPRCATPPRRAARCTCGRCSSSRRMGVPTVDYGNNIRQVALDEGVEERVRLPRLRAGLHPAAVLPRQGAVPLGRAVRRPGGHRARPTRKVKELFPDDAHLHRWLDMAGERIAFQGLPARICWIGLGERHRAGPGVQRDGATRRAEGADRDRPRPPRLGLGAPARTARPRRCATASDAVSDWPLLNALLNTAGGATWVSSTTAAASAWATRSTPAWSSSATARDAARKRIERVLWNDPATGVMRHADAGYDDAIACAQRARPEPADAGRADGSLRRTPGALTLDDAAGDPRRRRARSRIDAAARAGDSRQRRGRAARCAATRRSTASTPASASSPTTRIGRADLGELQLNLILSHAPASASRWRRGRAADAGAEGREPRARPLRRARRRDRHAARRAQRRPRALRAVAGLGRRLGRPRAARAPDAGAARRGRVLVDGSARAGRGACCATPASRRCGSRPRKAWR